MCFRAQGLRLSKKWLRVGVLALCAAVARGAVAQEADGPAATTLQDADAEGGITLNFPENTPLSTLIAYVSTRLGLNVLYDEAQVNQRITLKTPAPLPESALLDLLQSVLRARNLVLQETAVPGLMRIVPSQQLPEVASLAPQGAPPAALEGAVTQVFALEYTRAERVNGLIAPFVTKPGGTIAVLPEERLLVVTDYAENMGRIARLVELIDTPRGEPAIRAIEIKNGDAQALLKVVQPLLQAKARASGDPQAERGVMVTADPRTNHLLVVGMPAMVEETVGLVESLDAPRNLVRKVYRPQVVAVDRLDALIKKVLLPEPTDATYRAAADEKGGALVVAAPPSVHEQIESLLAELDELPDAGAQPVRFYKLTNTLAADVLATLESLTNGGGGGGSGYSRPRGTRRNYGVIFDDRGRDDDRGFGDNRGSGRRFDRNNTFRTYQMEEAEQLFESTADAPAPAPPAEQPPPAGRGGDSLTLGGEIEIPAQVFGARLSGDRDRGPTIAMDENTNSIIVVAPPAEQRIYEQIIQKLDQRRPQVLIETTIVSLDTSDGFTFGVDIGFGSGDGRIISFSQFGLSVQDTETGELTLPDELGAGGTLALLSPDIADVVIRALATASRSRLVSMPRVLVNDNETGILDSLQEEPYLVTVVPGGGDVVVESTDFAEAGTSITVTPHISDGDYLQLEYSINLSSFTGQAATNLPPPRQNNAVESVVTIPDGHTIVVGGLNQQNLTETIEKIPLLGDIPIIKHLFRNSITNGNNTTLFVFIRPTILRDDRFRDLRHLSAIDRQAADVPDDFPRSDPLLMEPAELGLGPLPPVPDDAPDLLLPLPESEPLPMEPE